MFDLLGSQCSSRTVMCSIWSKMVTEIDRSECNGLVTTGKGSVGVVHVVLLICGCCFSYSYHYYSVFFFSYLFVLLSCSFRLFVQLLLLLILLFVFKVVSDFQNFSLDETRVCRSVCLFVCLSVSWKRFLGNY